jgi:heat-inducible transcriptional repressor
MEILSNREKIILRCIIEEYIKSANPVGSRYISKNQDINLSPATIRNVMSDLESLNLITHQHTSGGRIPTDKGYRYFVDELMEKKPLVSNEIDLFKKNLDETDSLNDEIYKEISKILGKLSKEISIVSQPYISEGIFEKIELIKLSSTRLLIVVSIKSGFVRTLFFDINSDVTKDTLDKIASIINEKLSGLTLLEIRNTFHERIKNTESSKEVMNIFIDSIDRIFQDEKEGMTLYIGGTTEILQQPEFVDTNNYKNIIELTDEKDIVVHVLNTIPSDNSGISISIGSENKDEKLKDYSIISTEYVKDGLKGKIALIGPKRMNYSKMVSMLDFASKIIIEKIS